MLPRALPWGKRSSDLPAPVATPRRDRLLEAVIAQEQVEVLYQPQIDVASGVVTGAEALARWGSVITADSLFARAKAGGLSERLSRLMQRKALRAVSTWEGPLKRLGVSINALPQDICRAGYDKWLLGEIEAAGVDPRRVTLEITEDALLEDNGCVADRLAAIRSEGVKVAIDDFGTGYANLAYLTTLPLDVLKIDRGLVVDIVGGNREGIVMRAMIHMAHDLGLKVLVEGVETTEQLELLTQWGCDTYQGFLGARALGMNDLSSFVVACRPLAA